MIKAYTTVLTIAGSDGSGGAGIQADLKTFAALECYGLSVITALTAQNTVGVNKVYPVAEQCVIDQFQAISADISIDAIKIGMLGNGAIIKAVAALLRGRDNQPPLIIDTILSSSGGLPLLSPGAISLMRSELFPLATLITPNLPEAALLTGVKHTPETPEAIEAMAAKLHETGADAVLIKGGHTDKEMCCDCLLYNSRYYWFSSHKIITRNTHGTGCTLSSAIAAFLAKGEKTENAVQKAKAYIDNALQAGADYRLGSGSGPLHHCYQLWS